MKRADAPYFIEVSTNGCAKCSAGRTWTIVGPGDVGLGIEYEDEERAAELADMLNEAFFQGQGNPP